MKVLITGGTGLIGNALAKALLADNATVVVLTRDASRRPASLPPGVKLVQWDAKTGEGWFQEASGADAIVNLAGASLSPLQGLWSEKRKAEIRNSRVQAGQAVVDGIRRAATPPRVLIQGSAVGYYGTHGDETITEQSPAGNDFLASVCVDWEKSTDAVESMGVRRVLIRTGVVLDEDKSSTLNLLSLPFKLFVGGPVGSGKQYLPWIHNDDEVAAIQYLMEQEGISGPVNLTAPNPVTNKEFAATAGKVMNRPSFFPTPGFALKLTLGEAATLALDGQRAIPQVLQSEGFTFRFPNLEGALRDLL